MTRRPVPPVARLIALLLAFPALAAWDANGHRTVAEIAWEHMTPRARARAVDLLKHGPPAANLGSLRPAHGAAAERDRGLFLNAATWPDLIRAAGARHAYNHPTWHYADFYWDTESGAPRDMPDGGPDAVNAGERIVALHAILADSGAADTTKAIALAWLLHLVGDIHQPLHCSSRVTSDDRLPDGDKGGNAFLINAHHNLHWYWDGILTIAIAREPAEDSLVYATRLARRVQGTHSLASLGTAAASADVAGWEKEGLQVAQTIVYAGVTRGAAPSAAYQAEALKVAERRVALAGYRLAALLNGALK